MDLKLSLTKRKKDAAGTRPTAPTTSIRLSLTTRKKKRRCRQAKTNFPKSSDRVII